MIQFQCPCGKLLQAQEQYAGMQIACPACGAPSFIPGAPTAIQPAAAPAPPLAALPAYSERTTARPPAGPAPGGAPLPPERRPSATLSGKALASLILGILTFLVPVLLAIPAIVLGILAILDVNRSRGRLTGRGLAIAGLATGTLGNLSLLFFVWGMQNMRVAEQRLTTQNNLKQIMLAMHNHHDAYKQMPAAATYSKDGQNRPLLSWRVAILPYIEEFALYQQFRQDEPWDSPHNLRLLSYMPKIYAPVRGDAPPHHTHYMVFTGPKTPFNGPRGPRLHEFMDGTSNTILVVEADDTVPWTKPADLELVPGRPLPRLGGIWGNGFNVALADGSVRFVNNRVSENTLRQAIDPRDGQVMPPEWDDDGLGR